MASIFEIYNLCFDEDIDFNLGDILKLIERFFNTNQNINYEEVEIIDEIIKKIETYKTDDNKKEINKIINKYHKIIESQNKSEENETDSEINNEETNKIIELKRNKIRTDIDTIPPENVIVVPESYNLFEELIREELPNSKLLIEFFNNPKTAIVNSTIKDKNNLYALDRYGLIIRKKEYMKKTSPYAWKFDQNNEPIHYLTKPDVCDEEENVKAVLNAQYMMKKTSFTNSTGIIFKIYSKYYPERLALFEIYV